MSIETDRALSGHLGQLLDSRVREIVRILADEGCIGWTVGGLAARVNLSESRLRHLFKEATGVSISRFIIDRRLDLAARLLAGSHDRVGEVAQRTGFGDVKRFRAAFRVRFNASPSGYRGRSGSAARGSEKS